MNIARLFCLLVGTSICAVEINQPADAQQQIIVVVGAGGNDEFGNRFAEWADRWKTAASQAKAKFHLIGIEQQSDRTDHEILKQTIADIDSAERHQLWIVLIGHGTFDSTNAKFNLSGPDVSASELAQWLTSVKVPTAIINCASASGPFINRLSGKNRVIVTATKSGFESNFARFGDYFSAAILDNSIDLDKDQQTSLLEAFLKASADVQEFYDQESRLSTEHALLEDNGDKLGTPADWFKGIRTNQKSKNNAIPDGLRANQFYLTNELSPPPLSNELKLARDQLEQQLEGLRQQKSILDEDLYFRRLEPIMLELARIYERVEQ